MNIVFFPILLVDSILFLSFIASKLLPLYDIAEDISSILTISSGPDGTRTHDPKVVRPEWYHHSKQRAVKRLHGLAVVSVTPSLHTWSVIIFNPEVVGSNPTLGRNFWEVNFFAFSCLVEYSNEVFPVCLWIQFYSFSLSTFYGKQFPTTVLT